MERKDNVSIHARAGHACPAGCQKTNVSLAMYLNSSIGRKHQTAMFTTSDRDV
jgi:hypothetical protein